MDREKIMKQWDSWREYIAAGGEGSWPRDAFEALLDSFEEPCECYEPLILDKRYCWRCDRDIKEIGGSYETDKV